MSSETIYLLVRADDIGMAHAVNQACIDTYQNGIMRSVELMPICSWFPEAVKLLHENPQCDVGVHLALTSEWDNMKWRPLTQAKSLVTADGYFYQAYNKRETDSDEITFRDIAWDIHEIETELRAQLDFTLKHVPWCSHLGIHMGGARVDPKIQALQAQLEAEYDLLSVDLSAYGFGRFRGFGEQTQSLSPAEKEQHLLDRLENLGPGKWLFVDHPAYDTPEMRALYHKGYENVAIDRQGVTHAWTSERVKAVIERRRIKLISYADVKNGVV